MMDSTTEYLQARYALVASEHKRLTSAVTQARFAQEDGRNVNMALYQALCDRRDETWSELGELAASIAAVAGEAAADGTREGVAMAGSAGGYDEKG